MEGKFHPLIEAGAISHVWLGETKPDPMSVASFVRKTFEHTQNAQIAFSPTFTICNVCNMTSRGLLSSCPNCHSDNVDGITRVTGYYSKISNWNIGKKAELKDRHMTSV
jgi:ribonucleoside-triphosphate reductase